MNVESTPDAHQGRVDPFLCAVSAVAQQPFVRQHPGGSRCLGRLSREVAKAYLLQMVFQARTMGQYPSQELLGLYRPPSQRLDRRLGNQEVVEMTWWWLRRTKLQETRRDAF